MMEDSEEVSRETLADRAALEQIVGRPVADGFWPAGALPLGTRVRVVQDPKWSGPWAREFLGVVDNTALPQRVANARGELPEFNYFVTFDEPELDRDGAGPYRKAQIWGRYLRRSDI